MDEFDGNPLLEPVSVALFFVFLLVMIVQIALIDLYGDVPAYFRVHSATPTPSWVLSTLTHNSFWHIAMNSIGILLLGSAVERELKTRYFLLVFFAFGVATNVLAWVYNAHMSSPSSVAGASGAIYAFGGFYLIYATKHGYIELDDLPDEPIRACLHLSTTWNWLIWLVALATAISGLGMAVLDITGFIGSSNISHIGHAVGVLLGILLAMFVKPQVLENREIGYPRS